MSLNHVDIDTLLERVYDKHHKYLLNKQQLEELQVKLDAVRARQQNVKKAVVLVQETAQGVQQQLEAHVTNLVNLAIRAVFDDAPTFIMEITTKRNRTECELLFKTDDAVDKPIDSSGGGLLDIVSFALRVVLWTFTTLDNTLILDEPFKNVSPDLSTKVSEMVAEISKRLKLQIIMVSHAVGINTAAEKCFVITNKNGVSQIEVS